ncbi:WIAG-tail domain [Paenibacillus enshidis]|uniref:WIAG-tail domain n=1 Tax=Paenibacillus enshidis TaxID=1458439 RepID=A0ABV5AUZ2_9BACL
MKKNRRTPGSRRKKRTYYVDNPHINELDWLTPAKKAEIQVHAVAVPKTPAVFAPSTVQAEAAEYSKPEIADQSQQLADHSVLGRPLTPGSVQSAALAQGAVQSEHVAHNAIHTEHLHPKAVLAHNWGAQSISREAKRVTDVTSGKLADVNAISFKLGRKSVQTIHIEEGAVQAEHLADKAVQAEHLAPGSVDSNHLQSSSVLEHHVTPGAITGDALQKGAVSWDHLAGELQGSLITGEVDGSQIKSGALSWDHFSEELQDTLAPAKELDGSMLLPGTVEMLHFTDDVQASIQSLHEMVELLQQANEVRQPAITPIRCDGDQPALQQFGRIPFLMHENSDITEATVTFDEPFSNPNYILVAMINHSAFYAVLKSQSSVSAVLEIAKLRQTDQNFGVISWIAIGSD